MSLTSHFSTRVEHFYENFWQLVQPYHPFIAEASAVASHVRTLPEALEVVVGTICGNFRYDTDQHLWGEEEYWASNNEVVVAKAGDCDCLALLGSSILFAMGIPHYLTIGHLKAQLSGLEATPEAAPGHVWLEVDEGNLTYIMELTNPMIYITTKGDYRNVPYVPVERVLVQ